jgi:hypothetical protein
MATFVPPAPSEHEQRTNEDSILDEAVANLMQLIYCEEGRLFKKSYAPPRCRIMYEATARPWPPPIRLSPDPRSPATSLVLMTLREPLHHGS